ncbi:hypothetical protein BC829DRAFT_137196 [Chytridium lagenaria]|nr:hypothetical protein BC829DRAFT_137196 [Chytridium lagenaria]
MVPFFQVRFFVNILCAERTFFNEMHFSFNFLIILSVIEQTHNPCGFHLHPTHTFNYRIFKSPLHFLLLQFKEKNQKRDLLIMNKTNLPITLEKLEEARRILSRRKQRQHPLQHPHHPHILILPRPPQHKPHLRLLKSPHPLPPLPFHLPNILPPPRNHHLPTLPNEPLNNTPHPHRTNLPKHPQRNINPHQGLLHHLNRTLILSPTSQKFIQTCIT